MRRFSFRGMLAIVASALQALTIVYGLGAPLSSAHRPGEAGYCDARSVTSDHGVPADGRSDAGACLACQYCLGGFSPFLPSSSAGYFVHPRSVAAADWTLGPSAGPGSTRALAHRARAPPAFV